MFELALLFNLNDLKMKVFGNLLLIAMLLMSCTAKQPNYTVKVFELQKGWGYSIFENEKLIIRQQYIPSIQNQKHFKNKNDAFIIGELVVQKLKLSKAPSVSVMELKNKIKL